MVGHRIARRFGVPFVVTEHAPWNGWLDRPGIARQAVPAALAAAALMPVGTSVRTIDSPLRRRRGANGSDSPWASTPSCSCAVTRASAGAIRSSSSGWINYNKGIDVLLEAMRRLAERGLPGRLLLAGGSYSGTHGCRRSGCAISRALDLGDRVTFLGRQPPEAVARLMAESAVVVLPSRAESFGAVLVEALACGTPVVATRCGGPRTSSRPTSARLVPVATAER